jgi:hypothetical protein
MDCKRDSPAMHVGFILDEFTNHVSVQTRYLSKQMGNKQYPFTA